MKLIQSFFGKALPVLSVAMILILWGCERRSGKIPFNEKNAAIHVRPYELLKSYIDTFTVEKRNLMKYPNDTAFLNHMAVAESFNRDAIIALLNAPGAEGIRIYYGKKRNDSIAFVLLPVDAKGNDIRAQLINTDQRTGLNIPGIPSANAYAVTAQGVEDGQRCPTMCSTTR